MSATGISKEIETAGQLEELRQEVRIAAEELLSAANMKPGQILVVGCSSSEIASHKIGSYSSAEIGKAVFEELYAVTKSQGLYLAAQCCEHLNRALIVERAVAEQFGLEDDVTVSMLSRCPEVLTMEQVPEELVKEQFDRVLKTVQETAREQVSRYQGQIADVLVEEINEKGYERFLNSVPGGDD